MPNVGGVYIPDNLMPGIGPVEQARPGYGTLLANAASDTITQLRFGVPYALRKATGNLTPEQEVEYQQGLGQRSSTAPASVDDLTAGRVGVGRFIGENLVGSLPYMAGSLVGGAAGYFAGGGRGAALGAVLGGTPQFVGSNVDRAVQEQGGLSDQSATRSLALAPLQAASDVVGEAGVARTIPGLGRMLGLAPVAKAGGFVSRTAKAMVSAGATEAVTEAAQQVGERYAAGLPVSSADAVHEYVNAAVTAFAVGGVLGAAGGFRRSDAVAKPADQVTPDDMAKHIDGVLDGSLRALPSPEMFGRDPQGPQVESGPAIVQDDRPHQMAPPDFVVDSEGRVVPPGFEGEQAIAIDRNLPTNLQNTQLDNVTPQVQEVLDQVAAPVSAPLTASTVLDRGLSTPPAAPAPVSTIPLDPATGEEIPFDQHLEGLKKGLRGGFVQQVDAVDEMDLVNKVYDQVFVEQDTRANTAKFAQRLGLLDENLQPTQLAQTLEAERAATPAVEPLEVSSVRDPATGTALAPTPTRVVQLAQAAVLPPSLTPDVRIEMDAARKAAGIQRQRTAKGLDTPEDVMRALEDPLDLVRGNREGDAGADQALPLAKALGLVTDEDAAVYTPKGRQVFLRTDSGAAAITSAAQEQGHVGKQAAVFERAVRDEANGQAAPTFKDFDEMAAYQAGQVWAREFIRNGDDTKTAAQTNAIQSRLLARTAGNKALDKAAARRTVAAPREITPDQVRRKSLNQLIDTVDLTNVPDQEVVQLRRLVAAGASVDDIRVAIQKLQGGDTIRVVPPRPVARPIQGGGRGQPVWREIPQDAPEAQKAQQRAETTEAVEAYRLRELIEFARAEKGITDARAQVLHDLLDQGKTERVARMLKDFDPDAKPASKRLPRPPEQLVESSAINLSGSADLKLEQAITGKSFSEVLDHMVAQAPSRYMREIMKQVRTLADKLQKSGVVLDVQVVRPGDRAPSALLRDGARAYAAIFRQPPSGKVWLKSSEIGESGVNYQTVAHEMVHVVTMHMLRIGNQKGATGHIATAVKDLYDLSNAVIDHINARAAAGTLNTFELRFRAREHNALASVDEILAWGITNPEMQRYLATIEYKPRQSVLGRLVELLRGLLGLEAKYDTALTELLRVSEQLTKAPIEEIQSMFPRNSASGMDEDVAVAPLFEGGSATRTVEATNEVTSSIASALGRAVENLNIAELGTKTRRKVLGWISKNQIDRQYGPIMPGLLQHTDAHRERVAVRSRFEQMGDDAYQSFEKLERTSPNMAKLVGELMATTTEFQLDPDRTWEEHTHLANDSNAAALRRLHGEVLTMRDKLRRGDSAGWQVFNQFRALNEAQNYARMAASLHGLVAMDPELSMSVQDAEINPVDKFMREEGLVAADSIRDRWSELLQRQLAEATAFVQAKKGEVASGSDADIRAMRSHLSPIELQISAIHEALAGMQKAPYFHLGRFGDYFGSAVVRKINGQADPAALKHIAEVLEKNNFGGVQISTDNTKPKIALRFDTLDQAKRFQQLANELTKQGWLDPDSEIKVGPRNRGDNFGVADGLPAFVQRYIQSIEASPMYVPDEGMDAKERAALEKTKAEAVRLAIDTWLEQQPDSSISKVLVKRYNVSGYDKDMIRNFAHRWRVGSISIANAAAAPKFNQAFTQMRAQVNQAATQDVVEATKLNDILTEMKVRDSSNPVNETADTFDKARAFAHAYFLGLSPAYGLINMTQLGVTALPELAKAHGYAKSFHAMRRASATAFKILKAATNEAIALGPKHYADVAITENVLAKAGLSAGERNFALHMLATGTIDIGSAARALGQIAEDRVGSRTDMALKYASAMGMYTETFSRLTTALAARELHGDKAGVEQYATKVVSNSMFDYQSWNTARQLGKQGFAGPVTPLLTQFMSYSVQLTEKLYSEALDAFQRPRAGETAADAAKRKTEARRFLAGHLTAVTALAGTLGLPFATVFATVLERMVDMLGDDDEPYDATAAWRGFLADVLGKDIAEVVSRGLPRALGLDLSQRAGEQNLLPFSEFIADRRSWKESISNSAGRGIGAAPSMLVNILDGGAKIADGDVVGGMKDMLPVAFKGPIETYRMASSGYIDSKGNKLPLTPGASSLLWQLLGFTPDEKAEYQEARTDQQVRRGELTRQAESMRKKIVKALLTGDQDAAREMIADAQKFDKDNPAFAVVPSLSGAVSRQMQARARARALGTPLGVGAQDIAGQRMTRYANIDYSQ